MKFDRTENFPPSRKIFEWNKFCRVKKLSHFVSKKHIYIKVFKSVFDSYFFLLFSNKVLALDGENQVGRISKQWGGFVKEAFTDADTFGM